MTPLTQCRAHLEMEALRLLTGIREGEDLERIRTHVRMVNEKFGDMQVCDFDAKQEETRRVC